ncbi:hypothetical protein C1646_750911 [Rhizophagus diaphanus]|nr:hypothetical protein C1646_750911 [Rhizophagus diaphanus] [Rhizophagus sp. MUCL 43196]
MAYHLPSTRWISAKETALRLYIGVTTILDSIIKDKKDWHLDEMVDEMERLTGKLISIPALWSALKYLGITRKKLQKAAKERSELLCSIFMYKIGSEQLVFIDETSKDEGNLSIAYGSLSPLTLDGFIAADIIEGSCNKERFQTFILTQVLPRMNIRIKIV